MKKSKQSKILIVLILENLAGSNLQDGATKWYYFLSETGRPTTRPPQCPTRRKGPRHIKYYWFCVSPSPPIRIYCQNPNPTYFAHHHPPTTHTNSMSAISSLARFCQNLKGRFLGHSWTDFNCHDDIKFWQHLSRQHLSISRISQLLLTQLWPKFKGRFLGPSLTNTNCHSDICPGNICLGNLCQYQE